MNFIGVALALPTTPGACKHQARLAASSSPHQLNIVCIGQPIKISAVSASTQQSLILA
jgi:hypothetical protein